MTRDRTLLTTGVVGTAGTALCGFTPVRPGARGTCAVGPGAAARPQAWWTTHPGREGAGTPVGEAFELGRRIFGGLLAETA